MSIAAQFTIACSWPIEHIKAQVAVARRRPLDALEIGITAALRAFGEAVSAEEITAGLGLNDVALVRRVCKELVAEQIAEVLDGSSPRWRLHAGAVAVLEQGFRPSLPQTEGLEVFIDAATRLDTPWSGDDLGAPSRPIIEPELVEPSRQLEAARLAKHAPRADDERLDVLGHQITAQYIAWRPVQLTLRAVDGALEVHHIEPDHGRVAWLRARGVASAALTGLAQRHAWVSQTPRRVAGLPPIEPFALEATHAGKKQGKGQSQKQGQASAITDYLKGARRVLAHGDWSAAPGVAQALTQAAGRGARVLWVGEAQGAQGVAVAAARGDLPLALIVDGAKGVIIEDYEAPTSWGARVTVRAVAALEAEAVADAHAALLNGVGRAARDALSAEAQAKGDIDALITLACFGLLTPSAVYQALMRAETLSDLDRLRHLDVMRRAGAFEGLDAGFEKLWFKAFEASTEETRGALWVVMNADTLTATLRRVSLKDTDALLDLLGKAPRLSFEVEKQALKAWLRQHIRRGQPQWKALLAALASHADDADRAWAKALCQSPPLNAHLPGWLEVHQGLNALDHRLPHQPWAQALLETYSVGEDILLQCARWVDAVEPEAFRRLSVYLNEKLSERLQSQGAPLFIHENLDPLLQTGLSNLVIDWARRALPQNPQQLSVLFDGFEKLNYIFVSSPKLKARLAREMVGKCACELPREGPVYAELQGWAQRLGFELTALVSGPKQPQSKKKNRKGGK
ncbi:hypothetical protein KKF91_19480 [Myxococcota bacterium]|nr:hypothetical protein [Myxococcota bacterium]MBU1432728.1 hypothetical protein [Myxococcota bacterium]